MAAKSRFLSLLSAKGNKILGVAKNYSKSAEETLALRSKEPVAFQKPLTSLVHKPNKLSLQTRSELLVESELAIIIGKEGKNISLENANDFIGGYALACDFTSTRVMWYRQNGYDFIGAKCMDGFTPIGDFIDRETLGDYNDIDLTCEVFDGNGEKKLNGFSGHSSEMVYKIPEQIKFFSEGTTLCVGDIILTGTPLNCVVENGCVVRLGLMKAGKVLDEMRFELGIEQIPEWKS